MRQFWLLLFIAPFLFLSCSEDNQTPESPADADDNFITSVVMTVASQSYTAEIIDNIITITVPYTVSLNNAQVEFKYTSSATIIPDPASITDWDTERTFRVTSYNGEANDYTYKVIKDEIRYEGDVELKTTADVTAFIDTDVTVIKGDLIIGSDAEDAEELSDIAALKILKEVEGNIIIRKSYVGQDLTGLDNITSIGGLQIGTETAFATNSKLQMVSMRSLQHITGDIVVCNNQVAYVQFDNLETIDGNIIFRTSSLQSFEFPKLTTVVKDFDLQCLTSDGEPGGEITSLRIPELTKVNGRLGVNNLGKMISLEFPKLQEVGSVDFASIPIPLETLSLPELSVVNGDLNLVSSYIASDAFTSTGNNKLQEIDGLSNLSIVKGTLTISKFQVLKKLPDWSKLEQLGGLTLLRLLECSDRILDLSKVNFVPFEDNEPLISITDGTIFSKIITKEDMSQVSMFLAPSGITGSSVGIDPELNFKSIKNFKYSSNMTTDPVFQFERVYGNMEIIRGSKKGVSAPNLVSVDGYLSIDTTMANNISFPKLEIVGGQLCIIGNLNAVSNYDYDFTNLKSVGCSSNPQYIKEGVINNILYGSLDFMASNKDFTFPSLEHVGGVGMTVRAVKTISCPKLQAIDGTLCAANAASLTTFNMPTLTKLSGVRFIRLTRFVDYTFFKSFVEEEQIKKEDWLVTNCGYNPTYEDMQAGRYTQQ